MKVYKLLLFLFSFYSALGNLFAQNQNNNWFFGNKAAISFINGTPITLSTNKMVSIEGCASISDPSTGSLLFYTNGLQVWNANNTIMPNGSGLLAGANTSATQGTLILAYPGNKNLFYVFTVDETTNGGANGLTYSIVDMNENSGLGDIIPQQKNILIQNNTTERIAVTKNFDETAYWLVIHERNNKCFKSYEVNRSGINKSPVVNNIGSIHSSIPQANGDGTMGYMKFNHKGNKIAVAIYGSNKVEIFDFDKCSGYLSNPISISTIDNPYGIEFSPDDTKLYFSLYSSASLKGAVYQLNLLSTNPIPELVGISSSSNNQCMGALQLAPDQKIYISINSESWLSSINLPNMAGVSCGFIDKSVLLPYAGLSPTTGLLGLPPFILDQINNQIDTPKILVSNLCIGDSTNYYVNTSQQVKDISWSFDVGNANYVSTTDMKPFIVYPSIGSYNVVAVVNYGCKKDTLTTIVNITNCDSLKSICDLYFPNAFTPNNDGVNDFFYPLKKGNCLLEEYNISIFNRWGALIASNSNPEYKWNGKFKNEDCPLGTYFYFVSYKFSNQIKKIIKGDITLIR